MGLRKRQTEVWTAYRMVTKIDEGDAWRTWGSMVEMGLCDGFRDAWQHVKRAL
jgi:hypothetical protein